MHDLRLHVAQAYHSNITLLQAMSKHAGFSTTTIQHCGNCWHTALIAVAKHLGQTKHHNFRTVVVSKHLLAHLALCLLHLI
jgi:hypothetical protein